MMNFKFNLVAQPVDFGTPLEEKWIRFHIVSFSDP